MPSTHMRCPHCGALLKKSDADYVLGEAGSFIAMGSSELPCPTCGRPIDRMGIIKGKYDPKSDAGSGCAAVVGVIIVIVIVAAIASNC
jgi:endogenous inhibitor of DNA gyrase (YacG/DUF329 family)